MSKVPDHIVAAINTLLEPYGESYTPEASTSAGLGYLNTKDAWKYLGSCRSGLYCLVAAGHLRPIKMNKSARNGKVVYSVAELEAYIQSCR